MNDGLTHHGSPPMTHDSDEDSASGKKRSHANVSQSHEQVNDHTGGFTPEYEDEDEESSQSTSTIDPQQPISGTKRKMEISEKHANSKSKDRRSTGYQSPDTQLNTSDHEEMPGNEDESQDDPANPDEALEPFDWEDLDVRYHEMVHQKGEEEAQLREEFDALCKYFTVWAQTTSTHDVERSFKRIKTHGAFVRKQEQYLEQRRTHYVQVIDAFRQALALLGA